ncbi:MAG: hypothetical protein ABIC95_03490 [archaeon]
MKTTTTIRNIGIMLGLAVLLMSGVAAQADVGYILDSAIQTLENFFTGGYDMAPKTIDFMALFVLFFAIFVIGGKMWMKEQHRPVVAIAAVIAFMSAFSIVLAVDRVMDYLFPWILFLFMFIGLFFALNKTFVPNKFLAILLALLLTGLIGYLFWNASMGGMSGGGLGYNPASEWFGSIFGGGSIFSGGGWFGGGSEKIDRGSGDGALDTRECELKVPNAYETEETGLKDPVQIQGFAQSCIGPLVVTTYRSHKELVGKDVARANILNTQLKSAIGNMVRVTVVPGGPTWEFTDTINTPTLQNKAGPADAAPNQAIKARCECTADKMSQEQFEKSDLAPDACNELVNKGMKQWATDWAKEKIAKAKTKVTGQYTGDPIKDARKKLAECKKVYEKSPDDNKVREMYYYAVLQVHSEIGNDYFEDGRYGDTRREYEQIAKEAKDPDGKTDYETSQEALHRYYTVLLDEAGRELAALKKKADDEAKAVGAPGAGPISSWSTTLQNKAKALGKNIADYDAALNKEQYVPYVKVVT